jgi:acetolactate synthase-1/2/3 large subunit/5-guanidino-2-oxopentanoate decarboxylase
MLKSRGVDVIFGIPGVHNQEMYRGIEEAGISHVLARHEQGAGFMADGYARASGKPGVAYVITGPGVCNIMTPMGQAYTDSVPVLVISSCLDETAARKGQLHQMKDQRGAAATVCDWSEEARTPQAAYALIDRALREFEMDRPRSKHIQVPIAALCAPAPAAPAPSAHLASWAFPQDAPVARLMAARKPLFIFGGGARHAAAVAREVVKRLGAASFMTYAGRGICAADDTLCFGSMLARPDSARVIAQADLVVAVGTELSETDLWRDDLGATGDVIQVDIDPAGFAYADALNICCDARVFLRGMLEHLDTDRAATAWHAEEVAATRLRWRKEIGAERPGILPVCDALKEVLPEDVMIFSDMTQFAYAAKEVWDMDTPGRWHHPYGFGTLGYATPAAIGGAIARPDSPTMAIIGDYGFHYTMQELGVAVELGLSLPILLWDNGKLGEIEASMVSAQIAPNAVVARNPDFCKLAEAFGARSAAPSSLGALQQAVRDAFAADGPTLIHVASDIATTGQL